MANILEYVKPMEFTTGQVLGRANLGVLRDNDDYFNAVSDRAIHVPAGQVTAWESDTISRVAWDGWHLKRADMDTLYYYAELSNDDAGHPTTLVGWYDYNDDFNDTQMFTRSTTGTSSGTVDLSSFPDGLYRVTFIMTRAGGDTGYDATATIRAPYTIYTGSESYTAGHTITDGNTSDVAHFNRWRDNDIYFNAITPSQIPSVGMATETTLTSTTLELFNGWDKFHPDHLRMGYRIYLDGFGAGDVVKIRYDADADVSTQTKNITVDETWEESTWDITDSGYTKGNWYRVRVTLESDANAGWRTGTCDYLYMTAASLDASYTVMDPFTVDQFVYGSTALQDTRLQLLTDNDASIYDRLTWGAANPGRMDFACFEPEFHGYNGGWFYGNYRFKRRGDTLYYRTKGAELVLADGTTESLTDHDGTSGDYNTLDLNTIDLPHGSLYWIRRVSYPDYHSGLTALTGQVTDETLEFAMEV